MPGLFASENFNFVQTRRAFQALTALGFATTSVTPDVGSTSTTIRVNSVGRAATFAGYRYDATMIDAVVRYQSERGLPATGFIDARTADSINEEIEALIFSRDSRVASSTSVAQKFLLGLRESTVVDYASFSSYGKIVVKADGTGDYTTITAAIAAASNGDTILIADSTISGEDFDVGGKVLHFVGVDSKTTFTATTGAQPAFRGVGAGSTFQRFNFRSYRPPTSDGGVITVNASGDHVEIHDCIFFASKLMLMNSFGSTDSAKPTIIDRCSVRGNYGRSLNSATGAYVQITNSEFQIDNTQSGNTEPVLSLGVGNSSSRIFVHHCSVVCGQGGDAILGTATVSRTLATINGSSAGTGIQGTFVSFCWSSTRFTTEVSATTEFRNTIDSADSFSNIVSAGTNGPLTLSSTSSARSAVPTIDTRDSGGGTLPGAVRCFFDISSNQRLSSSTHHVGASAV